MRDLRRFRTHVEILKHSHPELVIQLVHEPRDNPVDITGDWPNCVLKWRGKTMHSVKSPEGESKHLLDRMKFAAGRSYVVFGIGLGHLAKMAWQRLPDQSGLIVVEPDLRILREALGCVDLRALLFDPRIKWVSGKDWREHFRVAMRQMEESGHWPSTGILSLPAYRAYMAGDLSEARRILAQFLNERNIDTETKMVLWDVWNRNLTENLPAILSSAPVRNFSQTFEGVPAVLVGAGPSLDENLEKMTRLKESALVMAVDTSLAPLLSVGCEPDVVLAMDAQEENALDFAGLPAHRTTLLFDAFCYPSIARLYAPSSRIVSMTGHLISDVDDVTILRNGFLPLLEHLLGEEIGFLQNGGSVITGAFDLARLAGCSAVGLIGADLAYPNFMGHSKLTQRSQAKYRQMTRDDTPETYFYRYLSEKARVRVAGVRETFVWSDRVMLMYKHWLEESAAMCGMPCFNLGVCHGASLKGYAPASVEEFIARYGSNRPDIDGRMARCRDLRPALKKDGILQRLSELRRDISALGADPSAAQIGPFDLDRFVQMASFEVAERLRAILLVEPEDQHLKRRQQAARVCLEKTRPFLDGLETALAGSAPPVPQVPASPAPAG